MDAPGPDPEAAEDLTPLVYHELRRIAAAYMRRERPGQTLQPTALVHEVYLRLAGTGTPWRDRRHFVAIAARSMRQILVERARARVAQKRKPRRLPHILSVEEVERVRSSPRHPTHRVLLMTTYAAGLRVSEVVRIQIRGGPIEMLVQQSMIIAMRAEAEWKPQARCVITRSLLLRPSTMPLVSRYRT